jgi:hypothetical protein
MEAPPSHFSASVPASRYIYIHIDICMDCIRRGDFVDGYGKLEKKKREGEGGRGVKRNAHGKSVPSSQANREETPHPCPCTYSYTPP